MEYPEQNRQPWNPEEDVKLIELKVRYKSRWEMIAAAFGNRTKNQIKNRWHSVLKVREQQKIHDTEYQLLIRANARKNYRID
jgi:hypothetical protein